MLTFDNYRKKNQSRRVRSLFSKTTELRKLDRPIFVICLVREKTMFERYFDQEAH